MFQSIVVIFRELLNINKLVHKMSVDIIKFVVAVQNWFESFGGCNVIDFKQFRNVTKITIKINYYNNNKYTKSYCVSVTESPS